MTSLENLINRDTLISSDPHFGDRKIYEYMEKRINFIKNNNGQYLEHYMINEMNKRSKETPLLILGDFAFKSIQTYGELIEGTKILLLGNHDKKSKEVYQNAGFDKLIIGINISLHGLNFKETDLNEVMLNCYIKDIDNVRIMFTHFPLFDDNKFDMKYNNVTERLEKIFKYFKCELNIHGHTHDKNAKESMCYNVSIEATDFKIFSIGDIIDIYKKEKII